MGEFDESAVPRALQGKAFEELNESRFEKLSLDLPFFTDMHKPPVHELAIWIKVRGVPMGIENEKR